MQKAGGQRGLSCPETGTGAEDIATYITEHCFIINIFQIYRKVERMEYITFLNTLLFSGFRYFALEFLTYDYE